MLCEFADMELAAAIDAIATEVLWEAGVDGPPVDALAVADELGIAVARDDHMPQRARYVRHSCTAKAGGSGTGTILVKRAERPEREQWAVAHEIGESVAHRIFVRLGLSAVESTPASREWLANRFASALLLPRRWFAVDGQELDWDLLLLKQRYATASHELIALRLLDMQPPVIITLCDLGRIRWRRSNVTAWPPALASEEKSVWRNAHVSGAPASAELASEAGIESIRCWPVHEPDWKREILRSDMVTW